MERRKLAPPNDVVYVTPRFGTCSRLTTENKEKRLNIIYCLVADVPTDNSTAAVSRDPKDRTPPYMMKSLARSCRYLSVFLKRNYCFCSVELSGFCFICVTVLESSGEYVDIKERRNNQKYRSPILSRSTIETEHRKVRRYDSVS